MSALFAKMNILFVMVDYKKSVYDQALIQVALIGDGASEEVIPTSSQILSKFDLDKINSGSTHTCCTHNIKNPS